eukprot:TRINITY_DN1733_c0_g1_i2.p1 TRINITY_DN1733_c0_g1~~TRINITY_DN1733_c0_g1_i2.p1  ORF type:complete len:405 (+),score=61.07 TRINITY_DN1733_c0_g1_i2:54-1268(+)
MDLKQLKTVLTVHFDLFGSRSALQERRTAAQLSQGGNYLKGCQWAPDGSCILTSSNDNTLRLFNTPNDEAADAATAVSIKEAELIYDYAWYPWMSSDDPDSCLFVSTCRDHPVHVWDAYDGHLRASFRNHDQYDAVTACFSLAFTTDGARLVCGMQSSVHVFDVSRPGNTYSKRSTWNKGKGCKGCISRVRSLSSDVIVCGGYNGHCSTMDLRSGTTEAMLRLERGITDIVHGEQSLVVGLRACSKVYHYDLRDLSQPVHSMHRALTTNQRLEMALDPHMSRWLYVGDQRGYISCYDLWTGRNDSDIKLPDSKQQFASTSINGISHHPVQDCLALATGQRRLGSPCDDSDDEDDIRDVLMAEGTSKDDMQGRLDNTFESTNCLALLCSGDLPSNDGNDDTAADS